MASFSIASIESFVQIQKELVNLELDYETEETIEMLKSYSPVQLQRKGVALLNLTITGMRSGLGGNTLLDFESSTATAGSPFPSNRFKVGDIVSIEAGGGKSGSASGKAKKSAPDASSSSGSLLSGVVARMRDSIITVAVKEEVPEDIVNAPGARFRVLQMGNEVTYKRMLDALSELEKRFSATTPPPHIAALLGMSKPSFEDAVPTPGDGVEFKAYDETLNPSQIEGVKLALRAKDVALIHGPPGTGKTQTVVELIRQLVGLGQRVLVCGPSNTSVDTLVERLAKHRLNIARLGHPARVKKEVLDHALEVRIRTSDEGQLVTDVRADLDRALASIQKAKGKEKRREAYAEVKALRGELRTRERTVLQTIVRNTQVVLCTLSGAASNKLRNEKFDTLVIDEASQAIEAECWIPLLKANKPTVKSLNPDHDKTTVKKKNPKVKSAFTLELTLFDRLLSMYGENIKRLLNIQYRMNELIMKYPSKAMYNNSLIAYEGVKDHLLKDLPDMKPLEELSWPILLIDTSDAGMLEAPEGDGDDGAAFGAESLLNRGEADLVGKHVELLVKEGGVAPASIAIISPYAAQVRLLRSQLKEQYPDLEIGTVDSFQGGEREAIILTLVRSNDKNEIGFLQDNRRLNVAITRARRHLAVVASVSTMARNPFLKGLFAYMEENGEVVYPQ
ncbi:hypothetical protein HDU97_010102 [Phlyctochytrium planicorne]|nr:hypothetical protein HDU97_010102 [Phlyctochytrium planicorne]